MPAIKHILFPFDFSEQGAKAVRFVGALATRFQARITVISLVGPVWSVPPAGMGAVVTVDTRDLELMLRSRLETALINEFAGLAVQRIASSGDPASKITEFAHANLVDLIMMPTHGCGLFRSLLIGSVTAKVLHDARCPVWTAAHAEEQRAQDLPRTILCPVDGSPRSIALMQWAWQFSNQTGATLRLLHTLRPINEWLSLGGEQSLEANMRDEAQVRIDSLAKSAGIDQSVRIVVGEIGETVAEEARQEGADLIVIGRGSLQSPLGRLRTHAYNIIQRSPCPVLSV